MARRDGCRDTGAGTVTGVMSPPDDPSTGDDLDGADEAAAPDPSGQGVEAPRSPRRGLGLSTRTIAICVCIALVAAIGTALVASWVAGGDDGSSAAGGSDPTIQLVERIDSRELLGTELLTVDGAPTSLGDRMSDRPVVVNLWRQDCAPCIKEMPLLEAAHLANPDIDFLGVDSQDRLDSAKVMAAKTGITYPWVQDPKGDFFFAAQGAGMPTTFIIMPSGDIVASKTGAFKSGAKLQQWLDDNVA